MSLHSTQSRAAAEALAAFFGADRVGFTATWAGVDRSFAKFSDAAKEAGKSRIYGGIHWSFDSAVGEQVGRKIGKFVSDNFFQPIGDRLRADAAAPVPVSETLRSDQVQPVLAAALARWRAAGVDTSALRGVEVRVADLGGLTLGMAANGAIWLDDNAAGWGWYVDPTPWDDSEFATPGDQGEAGRMDLLTVLEHEIGYLLGYEHESTGVMQEALTTGTRQAVAAVVPADTLLLFAPPDDSDPVTRLTGPTGKRK